MKINKTIVIGSLILIAIITYAVITETPKIEEMQEPILSTSTAPTLEQRIELLESVNFFKTDDGQIFSLMNIVSNNEQRIIKLEK